MPIQRKAEEVVPNLLLGLDTTVEKLRGSVSDGVTENSSLKLMEMRKELQDMKDVFPRVKNWEKLVMKEFDVLEEEIAEFEECKVNEEIEKKFEVMKERITKIKGLNNPIKLPSINSSTSENSVVVVSDKPYKTSDDWKKLNIEKNIFERAAMANLRISYDVLELNLKLCLLCFSIFPENSVIKKRALIYWWIGEGLVSQGGDGKTAKEMGESFFKDLIKKGMIKPVYKNKNQVVDSCKVHPWIRRMVILVAKEARFFDFDDSGNPTLNFSTTRPTSTTPMRIVTKGEQKTNDNGLKLENMLTLFNIDEHYLSFTREEFQKLKRVAVLQLGRWQDSTSHHIEIEKDEFLEGLGAQKHLKYLSLQGISRITELPASIGKLTNLKILDLRACHNLEKLPSGITYMKKLTHLDVSECYLLEHMPKGLESLVELQVLKGFVIGNSRSKDPCKLSALSTLTKLSKLSIYVGNDAVVERTELVELQQFKNLRILTIIWGGVARPAPSDEQLAKLKKSSSKMRSATLTMLHLSMPENLEKLDLRCFPQVMLPEWLSPDKLKKLNRLYIRGGKLGSLVHNENHPWEVTVLRLKYLEKLVIEWSKLEKAFPKLVYLEKIDCEKLNFSQCDNEGVWMKNEGVEASTNTL